MKLQYDQSKVKGALFSGYEAEGPRTGKFTLFIVGKVSTADVERELVAQDYEHIYFGAGGWHTYDQSTLQHYLHADGKPYLITVESPEDHEWVFATPNSSLALWILPVCWHGVTWTHALSLLRTKLVDSKVSSRSLRKIIVKWDYKDTVFLQAAYNMMKAEFKDYDQDQELKVIYHE